MSKRKNVFCSNCKKNTVIARQLCWACYRYEKRNGKARPRYLFTELCMNCKQKKVRCSGLCAVCYTYKLRTGKMRPRALYERYRFCDCGNRAEHVLHTPHGDIDLCQSCYDLENDYEPGTGSDSLRSTFSARRMDYKY